MPCATRYKIKKVREKSSNGVMDEGSGKVQEASAHMHLHKRDTRLERAGKVIQRGDEGRFREGQEVSAHANSFIVMNLAVVQLQLAAPDINSSALSNKEGKCHEKGIQRGDGRMFREGLEAERSH